MGGVGPVGPKCIMYVNSKNRDTSSRIEADGDQWYSHRRHSFVTLLSYLSLFEEALQNSYSYSVRVGNNKLCEKIYNPSSAPKWVRLARHTAKTVARSLSFWTNRLNRAAHFVPSRARSLSPSRCEVSPRYLTLLDHVYWKGVVWGLNRINNNNKRTCIYIRTKGCHSSMRSGGVAMSFARSNPTFFNTTKQQVCIYIWYCNCFSLSLPLPFILRQLLKLLPLSCADTASPSGTPSTSSAAGLTPRSRSRAKRKQQLGALRWRSRVLLLMLRILQCSRGWVRRDVGDVDVTLIALRACECYHHVDFMLG